MASMVANGSRDGQTLVLKGVDPETCMIVFKNHWAQVNAPLQLRQSLTSSEVQSLTFCRDFAERVNVALIKCSARCGARRNITTSLVSFMRLDLRAMLSFLNLEFLPVCPAFFELTYHNNPG